MKRSTTFSKFLSLLLLLCGSLAAGEVKQPTETFTVGTTSGYAPYVSLNGQGEYEGFDIDLAKLVAEKIGKKLVIKDLGSMPSLMMGLKQNKIDAIIWAVSITEERQKQLEMIYYQGERITSMPLLFWGKVPDGMKGVEDLQDDGKKIICVEAGTYQEQVMSSYPGLKVKYVDKITDAIMEIKFGKSLAAAIDNSLVSFVMQQNPGLKVFYFSLPPSQQSLGNGICINKKNAKLIDQVKKAVEELTEEGKVRELEKKWKMGA